MEQDVSVFELVACERATSRSASDTRVKNKKSPVSHCLKQSEAGLLSLSSCFLLRQKRHDDSQNGKHQRSNDI